MGEVWLVSCVKVAWRGGFLLRALGLLALFPFFAQAGMPTLLATCLGCAWSVWPAAHPHGGFYLLALGVETKAPLERPASFHFTSPCTHTSTHPHSTPSMTRSVDAGAAAGDLSRGKEGRGGRE